MPAFQGSLLRGDCNKTQEMPSLGQVEQEEGGPGEVTFYLELEGQVGVC